MANNVALDDAQAMDLSIRWITRLEQDMANKPKFLTRLNEMYSAEP